MSQPRELIFGVDFSGSSQPGRAIWISEAQTQSNGIQIVDCSSAQDRFGLPPKSPRDTVYSELRSLITTHRSAVIGFDFPFSLPKQVIDALNSWSEHITEVEHRFGKSVDTFRKRCIGRAGAPAGESDYLRRETDWRYGGQCPYQHQIQYQTYYGQRNLLGPLIDNDEARVLPIQDRAGNLPWLVEVYPAATLGLLGLYRQGYKDQAKSAKRRAKNLEGLRRWGATVNDTIAEKCRESDDALDSLTATIGVYRALQDDFSKSNYGADIEGQIFA